MLSIIKNLIKTAKISSISDDSGKLPIQQISYMGKVTDALIIMPYGLHANLPIDNLCTILSCNADDGHIHAIPNSIVERIKNLESKEVVLYHPFTKSFVHFKNNGDIEIESVSDVKVTAKNIVANASSDINATASGDINLQCSNLSVTGNVNINGSTVFTGTVMANGKSIDETHTHDGPATAVPGPKSPTGAVL